MNIAINGFGRIGRQALRIILEQHPTMHVVLINDLTDDKTLKHLFQFDSTYRTYNNPKAFDGVTMTAEKDPTKLPHRDLKVDVVLECTGVFRKREDAALHLKGGAKKVIISAFKIQQGFMTTIHSYTNDQQLLDLPHKDLRRARAAAINMVPTSTGAATAVGLVLPELAGKLDGMAIRVPTPTGSITDLTVVVTKKTDAEAVNAAFKKAAKGPMKGILGYEERELVLSDFIGDSRSAIIDAPSTKVHTEKGVTIVKVIAWYDNEWGYSNRLVELAKLVGSKL
ncbi:MAG: Glyceraldehyde-3-phosphate dehydrogenase [Candidatus Peregrinibacteria bacterium GW2011_GWA2_54_9]|nr:MAG: Glyceraldehyde-3-phosphate dehydrogenase [Candidatus Peregrinibacteria bacterium GW2011_GWA2_54_9]